MKILLMSLLQVQNAVVSGKTGLARTDEQRRWNAGTSKNLETKRLSQINFRLQGRTAIQSEL